MSKIEGNSPPGPEGFIYVDQQSNIKAGDFKLINLNNKTVSIFNVDGVYYAIDNQCAHKEAQLCKGDIEDLRLPNSVEGDPLHCVKCPKHRKKFAGGLYFDLKTGNALTKAACKKVDPDWRLSTYAVVVENDNVFICKEPYHESVTRLTKLVSSQENDWADIKLTKITKYNHDSNIYEFTIQKGLRDSGTVVYKTFKKSDLPLWHMNIRGVIKKENGTYYTPTREYTPISSLRQLFKENTFEILIKLYPNGIFSNHLSGCQVGDIFHYGAIKKTMDLNLDEDCCIGCIAGGTGITPFYQLMTSIAHRYDQGLRTSKLTLLYSNKKADDILLRNEIYELHQKYKNLFEIVHTLTREDPPDDTKDEKFLTGRINLEMITQYLSKEKHKRIIVSGPNGMWLTLVPLLKETGYDIDSECTELES